MAHDNADTSGAVRLGRLSASGFTVFLAVVVVLHFVQPELHPSRRFISEYAVGRMGWLLNAGFAFFAFGLSALATAFGWRLGPPAGTRVGGVLLGVSALGILASGLFNADLQGAERTVHGIAHDLAGFVAFFSLMPGAIIISRHLAQADRLRGRYRRLRLLAWLLVPLFLAMMFVFGPSGVIGAGQRIFLGGLFAWLLLAAQGLQTGSFEVSESTEKPLFSGRALGAGRARH